MAGSKATRIRAKQRKRSRLRLGLHRGRPIKPDNPTRIRTFLELQTKPKLVSFLLNAALSDPEIRARIRSIADSDVSRRKIFVHGLGVDSTDETLTEAFSPFGPIEDCSVVKDKNTGRAKGYGFVIYKTRSGAEKALKEPRKAVENQTIWYQLASVVPARPDDSAPSSVGGAHGRNLAPLGRNPAYSAPLVENLVTSRGLVNVSALGGATRSAYGGGMVGESYGGGAGASYGGGATRLSYAREMVGEPYCDVRMSYGRGTPQLPYGVGATRSPYGGVGESALP